MILYGSGLSKTLDMGHLDVNMLFNGKQHTKWLFHNKIINEQPEVG